MPTPTYIALANITLGSSASSVTFSSIPATYRDLVLVSALDLTSVGNASISFNGDTGANYSRQYLLGTGSSAVAGADTSRQFTQATVGLRTTNVTNIFDYSATDKHKAFIVRDNNTSDGVVLYSFRWANTAVITSINISAAFAAGTSFALYGIAS